jgi:hypothetical protein
MNLAAARYHWRVEFIDEHHRQPTLAEMDAWTQARTSNGNGKVIDPAVAKAALAELRETMAKATKAESQPVASAGPETSTPPPGQGSADAAVGEATKTRKPRAAKPAKARTEPASPVAVTPAPKFDPSSIPFDDELAITTNAATAERTDTAILLDDVLAFTRRYVVFPEPHHYVAFSLWVLHAWAINAFDMTPRLGLESPEPQSGKTLVLEVLNVLLSEAIFSLNVSVAALFRVIEDGTRPILFDEVDAIFSQTKGDPGKEDLRGVLNGGYSRGATVLRVKMPGAVLQEFHVFAPVALAAIGKLPATLESRDHHSDAPPDAGRAGAEVSRPHRPQGGRPDRRTDRRVGTRTRG